jgi:hypothetical protein
VNRGAAIKLCVDVVELPFLLRCRNSLVTHYGGLIFLTEELQVLVSDIFGRSTVLVKRLAATTKKDDDDEGAYV